MMDENAAEPGAPLRRALSLPWRLLLIAAIAVLPAIALLIAGAVSLRHAGETAVRDQAARDVGLAAAETARIVDGVDQLLVVLSQAPAVRDGNAAACRRLVGDVAARFPQYLAIGAADATGRVFCGAPTPFGGEALAGHTAFGRALATLSFAVGGYGLDPASGRPALDFAYPARDAEGHVDGVVYARLSLDWLARFLAGEPWRPGTSLTLADRQGRMLVHLPDAGAAGRPLGPRLGALLTGRGGGTVEIADAKGVDRIIGYSPLPLRPRGLFLAVGLPRRLAFAEVERASRQGAILIGACFVLALASAGIVGRRFIGRPIEVLRIAAARWAAGDYRARARLRRGAPEFRLLGDAFDRMAATIERREAELRAASLAKSHLLAAAGHDLKQPLQVIAMAHWVAGRHADAEGRRHLDRADQAVARLGRAFDNLLQAARIESGRLTPRREAFPVRQVLDPLADAFRPIATQKGLRLRLVASDAVVDSDPDLLAGIVQNLLGNAVKYARCGRVLVGCRRRRGRLAIEVIDTGPGIPADALETIFEAFRRLDPGAGSGMGLGLSIVRRLAALLDHPVAVRSTPGKGSCFSVEVPLAQDAVPRRPAEERPAHAL